MKRIAPLFALALLVVSAGTAAAYREPTSYGSSKFANQCQAGVNKHPGWADNYPYCNVTTSGVTAIGSYSTVKTGAKVQYVAAYSDYNCSDSGTISATCWAWNVKGQFIEAYKITVNMYAHTFFPVSPGGSTRFVVNCYLNYAVFYSVNLGSCGVLSSTDTDYVVGLDYTIGSPMVGVIPSLTTSWRTRLTCNKYTGNCTAPSTFQR